MNAFIDSLLFSLKEVFFYLRMHWGIALVFLGMFALNIYFKILKAIRRGRQ